MDGHQDVLEQSSEHPLSARERSLEAKIVRLENQLQGYKSHIDILDDQRQKLEERILNMEAALMKTKKELLKSKREVLDKDLAEVKLSEKLNALNIQAEKYKHLFMAEKSKNRCGIEKLEKLISNVKARIAPAATPNQFEDFKELVTVIQEGFQTQIMMVLDKLHEAEDKPSPKPGFQLNQGKKTNGKPLITLGRPPSGSCAGFNFDSVKLPLDAKLPFGSATTGEDGGKSILTFRASVNLTPKSSSGTTFQLSEKTAQVKPAFIFDSLDQTPKSSFKTAFPKSEKAAEVKPASIFSSLNQTPKSSTGTAFHISDKTAQVKPAFIFGSLDQKPKSSSGAALIGNENAEETKPTLIFALQDKKTQGKPLSAFEARATSSGAGFTFGSTAPSSGTGFSSGSTGTSEGAAKPFPIFGLSNRTPNSSSGLAFGSLKQRGNVTRELQAEEHKKDDSRSDEQTLEDVKQPGDKEQKSGAMFGSVATRNSGKDLLEKSKAEEGSWDCDICMVRNSSDKLECAACSSPKPGVEVSQDKKMGGKPLFTFGSAASETRFLFGSGSTPSGTGFLLGSAANSEGDAKPFFSFGSSNKTPHSSSGAALIFGSSKQGGNVTREQTEEDKKDVSGSDTQTLDEEVEQPGNEEGNGSATDEAQAEESKKEETASNAESETSTQDKQDVADAGSTKEEKFLFGSSNLSSLSFNSVAAWPLNNSQFERKITKSPGFADTGSTLFASQASVGEHKMRRNMKVIMMDPTLSQLFLFLTKLT